MRAEEIYSKLLGCSVSGYYNWKKQKRSIVLFLEQCFTKEELETYVLTGDTPSKIVLANQLYAGVYDDFTYFVAHTTKNKIYLMLLFIYGNLDNTQERAFDLYDTKRVTRKELSGFFATDSKNLTEALSLYIKENIRLGWRILEQDSLKGSHVWVPLYLQIIKLSIEQGVFEKTFGNDDNSQEQLYAPNHPCLFACYSGHEEIDVRYQEVLETVRDAFLSNSLDTLSVWSVHDVCFTMETMPV